ncbi:PTS sugar transporter subunit IIA [Ensifer adhaerens]|uniref:PTS sugar transporter subunit IIA n=1 Tax=Ensifer adhaerens TaxID=106592 RepID=A0A9Q9DDU6_ENSAD|nr:PTS sugar transporter subunit IIA [Ensifer adhaerens]USJ27337.1 PTS sugar transporter subunit IIA [Ensifer adhaerens]UTV41072.1 PTS sugar transporter subunit IIA [Ensifer adhaerens]
MQIDEFHWQRELIIKAPCHDGRSALLTIAEDLSERIGFQPKDLLVPLEAREALGSTGFGGGFALPHALVPDLRSPAKVLMTLRNGIDFGSPDDGPVDIFLAVLWPKGEHQSFLPALAKLCRPFRSVRVLEGLRGAQSKTEAMMVLQVFDTSDRLPSVSPSVVGAKAI